MGVGVRVGLRVCMVLALLATSLVVPSPPITHGATLEVNSAADTDDGTCAPLGIVGFDCTLREAINVANANPGLDTIAFNIPGGGLKTISVTSPLPQISTPLIINGFTQPGSSPNTFGTAQGLNPTFQIRLDGSGAPVGTSGLVATGGSSTVRGLRIENFPDAGVWLHTNGSNAIQGNALRGNGTGVRINSGNFNLIGGTSPEHRNRITGNTGSGVEVFTDGNIVQGNHIGLENDGSTRDGNGSHGVFVSGADNVIGGDLGSARNLISANGLHGVFVGGSGSASNLIQGNYIGTDLSTLNGRGNGADGIRIQGPNNTVGGTGAGPKNVIAGNDGNGIVIEGAGATGNVIRGNSIGNSLTGNNAVPNGASGIQIDRASNTTIGGTLSGTSNTIAANALHGIRIWNGSPSNTVIQGNLIGLDPGWLALGNGAHGIQIEAGANTTIGGTNEDARNKISGNTLSGIALYGGSGALIRGNYIGMSGDGVTKRRNVEHGIYLSGASNTTIGGTATGARNVISGNGQEGIWQTSFSSGLVVQGNYIGTDATGTLARSNGRNGVAVSDATGTTIGGAVSNARNVISGNDSDGVVFYGGATGNQILGNYIGTDVTGTSALPNQDNGVKISNGNDNTVGGADAAAANVISGNRGSGVMIADVSGDNVILGNLIGTNVGGTAALPNGADGVRIEQADANTIGGATASSRNVIAGNGAHGIRLLGSVTNSLVQGNYVGTNPAGTSAIPNQLSGVALIQGDFAAGPRLNTVADNVSSGNLTNGMLLNGASVTDNQIRRNLIGTNAGGVAALANGAAGIEIMGAQNNVVGNAGDGNIISGNTEQGVLLKAGANGNLLQGNSIGTNTTGLASLPNGNAGVRILDSSENRIGGTTGVTAGLCGGVCNRITGNGSDGVVIVGASDRNGIRGNSISANGGRGIDLNADALTPNDTGDVDAGPNTLLNFPDLTSVSGSPGSFAVLGTYSGGANRQIIVEYFGNTACDGSYGQGLTFLGAFNIATNAAGTAALNQALPAFVTNGTVITATATDVNGNTSEFSNCITAGTPPATATPTRTPTLSVTPPTATRTPTLSTLPATPTRTPTAAVVPSGHDFTLQAGTNPELSWTAGQTNGIVIRWTPPSTYAFLPSPIAPLLPGATSYVDTTTTPGDTYCYVMLAYLGSLAAPSGPDTRGISDLLCIFAGTGAGPNRPSQLKIALHETSTASLNWVAPGGQTRYDLHQLYFDGTPNAVVALAGNALNRQEPLARTTCFVLVAYNGNQPLGSTDVVCAAPGVANYPAALGSAAPRLSETLDRLAPQLQQFAPRR